MGMTMTQKILAHKSGRDQVAAGELITVELDLMLGNDITAPVAVKAFREHGFEAVFAPDKVALVMDHFTPNKDIKAAEQCQYVRDFAREHSIKHFYDVGEMGIEHVLLPEKGLVAPGEAIIGADSHTCTYGALGAFSTGVGSTDLACAMAVGSCWLKVPRAVRFVLRGEPQGYVSGKDVILHIIGMVGVEGMLYKSMEFSGSGIQHLSMSDRFCIANMAVEAGAKNGIFPVDIVTLEYIHRHSTKTPVVFNADEDAEYERTYEIDLAEIELTVAAPHLPENTRTIGEVRQISIDQVVIGSCTNGRLEDLMIAAEVFKGKKVAEHCRAIVIPGTPRIYKEAMKMGLLEIFIDAGCAISTPTCGPCLGGHMGILAQGERAVATTNRNFVGRMGHPESEIYLAGPAVAAASAILGRIGSPEELE